MAEVADNLANLVRFAIAYFENLLKKYGAGRDRKTQIRTFDVIIGAESCHCQPEIICKRHRWLCGIWSEKRRSLCAIAPIWMILLPLPKTVSSG